MSQTALIVVVIAIVVVLAIIGIALAVRGGRSRLHDLPPESKDRYGRMWQAIEAQFIESPADAVREADRCVVGVLSERGATLHDESKAPDELKQARQAAASDKGRQGTEGMREAMVHYKHIVENAVGDMSKMREGYRREVAS